MNFKLVSDFQPTGDQPQAIDSLVESIEKGNSGQVLLGVTGSGKTFTLAVNYICMLIEHPDAYRHILAVTFTNKATAEMKQRIISKLYGIAHETDDALPYLDKVKEATGLAEETIRERARKALQLLVHDHDIHNHFCRKQL